MTHGHHNVARWRRTQIVLWAASGYEVGNIAKMVFTSHDRVRDVMRSFNVDGFSSLWPEYLRSRGSSG